MDCRIKSGNDEQSVRSAYRHTAARFCANEARPSAASADRRLSAWLSTRRPKARSSRRAQADSRASALVCAIASGPFCKTWSTIRAPARLRFTLDAGRLSGIRRGGAIMSGSVRPDAGHDTRARRLRGAIYVAVAVQILLYLYLYIYIFQHSNPRGDGMEWVAVMPATFVLALGVGPALGLRNRRWLALGVLLAIVGVLLNIAFFLEIAREFAESAR
jgi:hypothetical protein